MNHEKYILYIFLGVPVLIGSQLFYVYSQNAGNTQLNLTAYADIFFGILILGFLALHLWGENKLKTLLLVNILAQGFFLIYSGYLMKQYTQTQNLFSYSDNNRKQMAGLFTSSLLFAVIALIQIYTGDKRYIDV